MNSAFKIKSSFSPLLEYPVTMPLFFLGSCLLYNPFDIKGYYSFGSLNFSFHLVMISSIILVTLLISRLCLSLILERHGFQWKKYVEYCAFEMMVISAFSALYTVLFKGNGAGYFNVLGNCIKFIYLSLIYPYTFLILVQVIRMKNEELEKRDTPANNTLLRFYDEHKRLKLSIAPSAILFVKSESNYVKIHYLDGGKIRNFMLRASMKSLEDMDSKALTRCQRSYFVNPEHISALRKDPQGFIFAEMNNPDIEAVPVSKQYYDQLSALL